MDINQIINELDELIAQGNVDQMEGYLQNAYHQAQKEQDVGAMLTILNEWIGVTRETCRYEDAMIHSKDAMRLIAEAGLVGTIHHGTTLLNIANALRAAGHLQDSYTTYQQVEEIYGGLLQEDDMNYAGLYNNMSLLCQEMGDYEKALSYLKKAYEIVSKKEGTEWEIAVTQANIANTMLEIYEKSDISIRKEHCENEWEVSLSSITAHCEKALELFESMEVADTHYAAALLAEGKIQEIKKNRKKAALCYKKGMDAIESTLGKTEYYYRLKEYYDKVADALPLSMENGMALNHAFYEEALLPMLEKTYRDFLADMAIGLVGEGSDCYELDDVVSRDHDWGIGLMIWLPDSVYSEIGESLQKDYSICAQNYEKKLVEDGRLERKRYATEEAKHRTGVKKISDFYAYFLGKENLDQYENNGRLTTAEWLSIPEYALSACVNGRIFQDDRQQFTKIRTYIKNGYPLPVVLVKLAQAFSLFSQNLQYNYTRMKQREDVLAMGLLLEKGLSEAFHIAYVYAGIYEPHTKWVAKILKNAVDNQSVSCNIMKEIEKIYRNHCSFVANKEDRYYQNVVNEIETLATVILETALQKGYLGQGLSCLNEKGEAILDRYLDHYARELYLRSQFEDMEKKVLVAEIVKMEFAAFDHVKNEGGRAGCQDDWETFEIMRSSQYLVWEKDMLVQYAVDFTMAIERGWNPIMEKYGRMEESTAPERWEEMKDSFPVIPEEKKKIMEEIIKIQVSWMEAFAGEYPKLAGNARRIHTSEDMPWDTSYETYLRGEMGTYSDKMLELYGRFIVGYVKQGKNLAYDIMKETVKLYGYKDLDDAAKKM